MDKIRQLFLQVTAICCITVMLAEFASASQTSQSSWHQAQNDEENVVEQGGWIDDLDTAQSRAAAEGKAILISFTGSDWCGWCKKFNSETLSSPIFMRQASRRFILMVVDSPADKSRLSIAAQQNNPKLVRRFNVHGFPTLVIADTQGKEITRISGYVKGGPVALWEKLDRLSIPQMPKAKSTTVNRPVVSSHMAKQPITEDKSCETAKYSILKFNRESGNEFSYRFVLALNDAKGSSLRTLRLVQQEFREAVKTDYADSFPGVNKESLFVDFPEYELDNGRITGRAVVLSISVTSLTYDPKTRNGKLAVKVNANQYEEARKWIRKNIETLARDKNIALTTGEIPPAAKFYLGREELKDGNILEIEFKTE